MTPQIGQPFRAGAYLSIGDPEADPGTDAYQGVIVTEPAGTVPSAAVIDPTKIFNIKAYFRYQSAVPVNPPPPAGWPGWNVDFYITDLTGNMLNSPYSSTGSVSNDVPQGAVSDPSSTDFLYWFSFNVDINANELAADTIYRISVDGDDGGAGGGNFYFVFHDLTIIKTM
jgi:hypothetical protein